MFYVLDDNNNKVEAYDKQEVLAVIEQAIADGSLANLVADAAFVDKLKCCVTGGTNRVAFVTQAKYNELAASDGLLENCLYFITDDTTADGIDETLETFNDALSALQTKVDQMRQLLYSGSLNSHDTVTLSAAEGDTLECHCVIGEKPYILKMIVPAPSYTVSTPAILYVGTNNTDLYFMTASLQYVGEGVFKPLGCSKVKIADGTLTTVDWSITKIYKINE